MDYKPSSDDQKWLSKITSPEFETQRLSMELVSAAHKGELWKVQKLLKHGAHTSYRGEAALRRSVEANHVEIVKLLIDDIKLSFALETDLFKTAINTKSYDVAQFFIDHSDDIHEQNNTKTQTLCILAERGELDLLKQLVKKGFELQLDKNSLIFNAAAKKGRINVMRYFVELGYDINTHNGVAITFPISNQEYQATEYLLQNNLPINSQDNFALKMACAWEDITLLQLLVHYGADIRTNNYKGLYDALSNGRLKMLELLLDLGCDQIIRNPDIRDQINCIKSPEADLNAINHTINQWLKTCINTVDLEKIDGKSHLFTPSAQTEDCLFAKALKSNLMADVLRIAKNKNIVITAKDLCQKDKNGTPLIDLIISRKELKTLFNPKIWKNNTSEMKKIWQSLISSPLKKRIPFESYYNQANILTCQKSSLRLKKRR